MKQAMLGAVSVLVVEGLAIAVLVATPFGHHLAGLVVQPQVEAATGERLRALEKWVERVEALNDWVAKVDDAVESSGRWQSAVDQWRAAAEESRIEGATHAQAVNEWRATMDTWTQSVEARLARTTSTPALVQPSRVPVVPVRSAGPSQYTNLLNQMFAEQDQRNIARQEARKHFECMTSPGSLRIPQLC